MNKLEVKNRAFYIDGKKTKIIAGDIHYFRIAKEDWGKRLDLAKDFGLNTIQTYVPWNKHEPKKGVFDFEGMLDLAAYLKLAQEKGLYVMLRCAPYICSEWDLGGLPSRLLKDREMVIRTSDPKYLKEVEDYYKVLVPVFKPYLATNGGNVIAVAVENEYGSYGNDHKYMEFVGETLEKLGVDVPLYTTDGDLAVNLNGGRYKDNFFGVNFRATFGTSQRAHDIAKEFDPENPFFIGEFWAGRSIHWGEPFHDRPPEQTSEAFREALELDGNVCFYMFSGGTNFGYMGGANYGWSYSSRPGSPARYIPHATSYDEDALIREDGTVGEKYFLCRDVLDKYLGKEPRPHVSPEHKAQSVDVKLTDRAYFFDNLDVLTTGKYESLLPKPMEDCDQDYGVILYTQTIDGFVDSPRSIAIRDPKDRATIFKDGEWFATYVRDRDVTIPEGTETFGGKPLSDMNGKPIELNILVENLGRINFGEWMPNERKGIHSVSLSGKTQFGCTTRTIDFNDRSRLEYKSNSEDTFKAMQPMFLKGEFDAKPGVDTYVEFSEFGHGYIFINGFNLGRFDSAGPMMTLYLPGALLKEKDNLIEVVDFAPKKFNSEIKLLDKHLLEGDAEHLK